MKVTPFLNIKKTDNVADIEIFGDIGYNVWADTYEEYKANTSEQKAEEIKALQNLGVDVINVTLESLGGDVSHALAIYSLLKNSGATINTYYRGVNASASTIIGSAATSVKNIYMDNTGLFLVHKVMSYVEGNENDMQDMINDLEKWQGAINQVYLNLGVEKEVIAELMERNGGHGEYLNFKEAKKYGFVGKEWETKKVANYSRDTFVEKELLVPNFINNQKEEKMEVTTPNVVTEEKTLLQKIWNKISNESETPSVENEVDNEVTPEEQTAIVDEVMQLLEPRIVALEEAMAELMPKEEEAEEEPMEEEMVEDKKENLSEVIKNEIAEAFKNFVEPTPTKSNKTNSVNEPTWKQHLNNFQNFIK
jgi:ATP-dependent protease ClpP protease subunit